MTDIRVLHVDDDPAFVDTARTLLEAADDDLTVRTELTAADALEHMASEPVDCVVSDYDMTEQSGVEFLEAVRADHPYVPFILFTGRGSESVASAAISAGVTDYLQKSLGAEQWTVLANRIENAVEAARARRDLERREHQHEAVATLSRAALDGRPLAALVDDAVEAAAAGLEAPLVEALATTPDGDRFDVVANVGWDDDETVTVDAAGDTVLARALATRDPVTFSVEDDDPTLPAHHDAAGVYCGAAIRIGPPDDPWGVLGAYDTDRRRATGQDRSFLQNLANVLETTVERRRADRERRETESRFREIAELSPDTIFRVDPSGEFEWVSPAHETLLGYEPDGLVGERFETVVEPEGLTDAVDGFQRVLDGETVRKLEVRLRDADDDQVDAEINASPVFEDGEVVLVQGLVRDVTDRQARERELERTERAFDAAPIGIVLTDPTLDDNPIVYVNDRFESLTGYDAATAVGRNCRFLQGPDTDTERVDRLRAAIDAQEPVSVELLNYRQDGSTFWNEVTVAPIHDEDGDLVNFVGFQRDVTDRRERELSLQRFRQALEQAGSAIYLTDPDRVIQYVNPAFEEITGYTAAEAIGATPQSLSGDVHDHESSARDGWERVTAGEVWTDTVVDERSTGERYTAVQTIAPIRDDDEVTGYVAIQNDVSDQLLDRQRLSVLHRVIRHNLRNDQNLVMGTVELVMDRLDDPDLEDSLQTVVERSKTLLTETEKVRQVQALLNRDEYAATTVDEVLEGLTGLAEAADATDVSVHATTDGDETVVDVVERALAELLENAIEHTSAGTPVTVDVERADDTHLLWTVSDHGSGLPPNERRVLERGTETPLEHSEGLGLWMANWLVQAAGGTISFEPNEPTGSTIHVRVPRVDVDG